MRLLNMLAGQDEEERLSGATATVVLARSDKLVVANVGDSRAVLSRRCAAPAGPHACLLHEPHGLGAPARSALLMDDADAQS